MRRGKSLASDPVPPTDMPALYTIGYEGLVLDQFIAFLHASEIEHLIDIREAPVSRKAGFSKDALSTVTESAGIRYSHVRALGCPKPIRDRYRKDQDWARYTRDFKIYLAAQMPAIDALRETAASSRTCILCYESDYTRCHRAYVGEAVVGVDGQLMHIVAPGAAPQAPLLFD